MTLLINEDQRVLRAVVREFVGDHFSSGSVRALAESASGHDPGTWKLMTSQLGLTGLQLSEESGGSGAGFVETALVLEEMGYGLASSPLLATTGLAVSILLTCGDAQAQADLLPGIAEGSVLATAALHENAKLTAHCEDGWLVDGICSFAPDAHLADLVLLRADTVEGPAVLAVRLDESVAREPQHTLDLTRRQVRLTFAGTPARMLAIGASGESAWEAALDLIRTLVAAEQLGGAQRCLDMSVEYAKIRTQFGRKIGSFQAVKHRCADMLVAVESARAAVYHAVESADSGSEALRLAAPMAFVLATEAYQYCARQNIQVHGGIGCTWEHDAHLHYRRAHATSALLGGTRRHRALLACRLGM